MLISVEDFRVFKRTFRSKYIETCYSYKQSRACARLFPDSQLSREIFPLSKFLNSVLLFLEENSANISICFAFLGTKQSLENDFGFPL